MSAAVSFNSVSCTFLAMMSARSLQRQNEVKGFVSVSCEREQNETKNKGGCRRMC